LTGEDADDNSEYDCGDYQHTDDDYENENDNCNWYYTVSCRITRRGRYRRRRFFHATHKLYNIKLHYSGGES